MGLTVVRRGMKGTALFDCPHCIDEFAFDYQKIAKLAYGWRAHVRCPGCGNIVEVVMLAYTVIHGCDPTKYQAGEITEILPPDPKASPDWRMAVNKLRMEICKKKRLDGDHKATPISEAQAFVKSYGISSLVSVGCLGKRWS